MPRRSPFVIRLSVQERAQLEARCKVYTLPYRDVMRAKIVLLASDGLTNHISEKDLIEGPRTMSDPQSWAEHLVAVALKRGSRDNVTCVVLAFDPE